MPITNIPAFTPLSNFWTHEQVVSEAMVLTNTIDNEAIQLDNIRNHMNSSISYIANLLNLSSSPWYGIYMTGTLETTLHPSGLEWIDLAPQVGTVTPNTIISGIRRINSTAVNPVETAVPLCYDGNWTSWDLSNLVQQNNKHNVQHRFSVAWQHHGDEIVLFVGNNIETAANAARLTFKEIIPDYSLKPDKAKVVIWAHRIPILDDLKAPNDPTTNYLGRIDVPDKYVKLVLQLTQKSILEQLSAQVPAALEQEINQAIVAAQGVINNEIQLEAADREKRKYGNPQKSGGM